MKTMGRHPLRRMVWGEVMLLVTVDDGVELGAHADFVEAEGDIDEAADEQADGKFL